MRMKNYLMILCFSILALFANAQVTLVKWTFDDDNLVADAGIAANAAKAITAIGTAQNFSYPAGLNSTHCLSETGWDNGADTKYWQFDFVATGYENLTISSKQKSSNTGPKDFKIQYKIGTAGTWTDVSGGTVVVANDNFVLGAVADLALPAGCNDQASVYIRYLVTSTVSTNGSTVASTGTSRQEDLEIKGTEISGSDVTPPVFITGYPKAQSVTNTSFQVAVQLNEPGTAYFQVLADGATAPTVNELITNGTSIAVAAASTTCTADVTGLTLDTSYDLYVVAQDDEATPNVQASVTLVNVTTTGGAASLNLFFSEYIEGSANNKAIEIYNPNNAPVDMSAYTVKQAYNATGWSTLPEYNLALSGTLAPHDVYVLYATGADNAIVTQGDWTAEYGTATGQSKIVYFNGNDPMGLFKDGVLVDAVGNPTLNDTIPCAGVPQAGKDHTFVRKISVTSGNTDWASSAGTNADNSEWIVYPVNTFDFIGYHGASQAAEILTFTLPQQTGPANINSANATVQIQVGNGTNVTALVPTITVSPGAQLSPTSGVATDFTNPKVYRVTAENGTTYKDWTVTVTVAAVNTEANILSFVLPQQTGPAEINTTNHTVTAQVVEGTNLSQLTPTITVSYGATINPASGAMVDFSSGPVTYIVTAEDQTTVLNWSVTVTVQQIVVTPIKTIQFTVDSLNANATIGGSSLADQIVTTRGIVTAIVPTKGFFIQNAPGAWNGIYVYTIGSTVVPTPVVGDDIRITAKVKEYFGYTELTTVTAFTVISSGNPLPAPVEISAAEVGERFEGVLVYLHNYTCINIDFDAHNNSLYTRGSEPDTLMVHTMMLYPFNPLLNNSYSFTGIVNYDWNNFKVEPRDTNDVVIESVVNNPPVISGVFVYPDPYENVEVGVYASITDDVEIIEKHFFWGLSDDNITNEVEMTEVMSGSYKAMVPGQAAGVRVFFQISASDIDTTVYYVGHYDVISGIHNPSKVQFGLYPNPANDMVVIDIADAQKVSITNVLGVKLAENEITGRKTVINIANLANGIYFVTVTDHAGNSSTRRLIKK